MTPFIDSHAHLYGEEFDEDRPEMMARAFSGGVQKMLLPNIDSSTVQAMLSLEKDFPGSVFPMMGLHPCYVNGQMAEELDLVRLWLDSRRFFAVGEIGLDFHWDLTHQAEQMTAFSTQLDWAMEYDLPVAIHSRDSTAECIEMVRSKQKAGRLKGVFHCFSGTREEATQIIDLGFYLGIGGVVTFKKSTLSGALSDISLEHLLLETDAPYLAPVPYRGKRNESAFIPLIAEKLADLKQTSVEEVARITTANAVELFSL